MSEQHPSKRRKANPIEVDIVEALSVVLDWIEQFPKQSTCHIILVSPRLTVSPKERRVPRLHKRDVNLSNHHWFISFPGKCNHSFTKAAAQNGDFLYLQTCVTTKIISIELHDAVLTSAMRNDDLTLLCWLRGFTAKVNRFMQSSELKQAVKYGSIRILNFLLAPSEIRAVGRWFSIHIRVFQWVSEQYPIIFQEWKADTSFMKCAASLGNVETLNYLHSQGFPASYKKLYTRALRSGRANVLEWVHENLPFDSEIDLDSESYHKEIAASVLKHHPDKFTFWFTSFDHGPEVYWYCLKKGISISSCGIAKLVCSDYYWKKIRTLSFPNQLPFSNALSSPWVTALTVKRLQYLLNCGLKLDDRLFQLVLENCNVKVCKFLWAIYDGNCNPRWPTRFTRSKENPAKWEWLQTILPLTSSEAWKAFTHSTISSECLASFEWVMPRFPKESLWVVSVELRYNVDFTIALVPYLIEHYEGEKVDVPDGARWDTHKRIEFLALNGDKLKLGKNFLPRWPNDFKFFQENAGKFEWGPQKGKKITDLFARCWSEENFQHWLSRQ
jgi:hypothetical protein